MDWTRAGTCGLRKKKRGTDYRLTATVAVSRSKRWFLADPSLIGNAGHCARYLLSLAAPLRQRGEIVHILGNRNISDTTGDLTGCEPVFTLRCDEAPFIPGVDPGSPSGIERLRHRRTDLFGDDLNRLADRHQLTESDTLLINSLRHWSLEDVLDWLETRRPDQMPTVVLVLHYTPFPQADVPDPAAAVYRDAFKRIANSAVSKKILLCTDSERLAAEYKSLFDISIHVLPIPHSPQTIEHDCHHERPFVIGFAGEARRDKGFHLLPYVVRKVLEKEPERDLVFNLQAYGFQVDQQANPAVQGHFPSGNAVRIISNPLSEKEYEAFIAAVDLMLIPYMHGPYRAQTSGVYCEAAALGTPVLVPADTWMADQVARNGGGIVFQAGDADSLAMACLEAIRNYPMLSNYARRAAPDWRAFHSAINYINCLKALLWDLPKRS